MNSQVKKLTFTALMAAMITIFTAYICHIPVGQNGGYIHFGDSLIYIAACLLPWPYAMTAAAIGGGMADLLTAPIWAPATIIIKALISIPFTNKSDKNCDREKCSIDNHSFRNFRNRLCHCRGLYHIWLHKAGLHRSHRNNSGFCSGKLYTKRWKCYNICYSWTGT